MSGSLWTCAANAPAVPSPRPGTRWQSSGWRTRSTHFRFNSVAAIVLADEPTAALDTDNGYAIMSILAEIAKNAGRGVLVVTHDPRLLSFANRVVRIEDGRLVVERDSMLPAPSLLTGQAR
jgi:ABC-type dipeptide/oligopeptide/nickel transport system ATPase component